MGVRLLGLCTGNARIFDCIRFGGIDQALCGLVGMVQEQQSFREIRRCQEVGAHHGLRSVPLWTGGGGRVHGAVHPSRPQRTGRHHGSSARLLGMVLLGIRRDCWRVSDRHDRALLLDDPCFFPCTHLSNLKENLQPRFCNPSTPAVSHAAVDLQPLRCASHIFGCAWVGGFVSKIVLFSPPVEIVHESVVRLATVALHVHGTSDERFRIHVLRVSRTTHVARELHRHRPPRGALVLRRCSRLASLERVASAGRASRAPEVQLRLPSPACNVHVSTRRRRLRRAVRGASRGTTRSEHARACGSCVHRFDG
mmetsp:Transcript_6901/g.42109  ORF Transcript_6901/g.42109 Transcript_6901/m.42109 type:complete len:310 (+) Transcript_6901:612-1541(+)